MENTQRKEALLLRCARVCLSLSLHALHSASSFFLSLTLSLSLCSSSSSSSCFFFFFFFFRLRERESCPLFSRLSSPFFIFLLLTRAYSVRRGYAALARAHICVCGTFKTTKRETKKNTHSLCVCVFQRRKKRRAIARVCVCSIAFICTSIEEVKKKSHFFCVFFTFFSSLKIEEIAAEHSLLSLSLF